MDLNAIIEGLRAGWGKVDWGTWANVVTVLTPLAAFACTIIKFVIPKLWPKPRDIGITEKSLPTLIRRLGSRRKQQEQAISDINNVFGDPVLLSNYYIVPKCQHHNPADYNEDDGPRSDLRTSIFDYIGAFLKKPVALRNGGHQLFILADAGMGKTSVLIMLKLGHLLELFPPDYACLLLKLGPDSLATLRQQNNKDKTVVLLDALDEDPMAWGRFEARLDELLRATEYFRHVIITCRTQFFPETDVNPFRNPGRVTVGDFICPMIFLSLFDDDQVDDYLRKRFSGFWGGKAKRVRAKKILDAMQSLRFRPLLLAHIGELMEAPDQTWNEYTVYQALLDTWLKREHKKLREQNIQPLPTTAALWDACTLLAVHLQGLGLRVLAQDDLCALVADMPAIALIENFEIGGRSLLNRNSARAYRFAHYSIQEFLVAHALVEGKLGRLMPTPNQTESVFGSHKLRVTEQILAFLACQENALVGLNRLELSEVKLDILAGKPFSDRLNDGSNGPAMVFIPGGRFLMGSPENEAGRSSNERQHEVEVVSFGLGKYAVTFEEYDLFCQATGRDKPADQAWGRGKRPVINVSWYDANAYADWLSAQTGQHYRLPTEAEWEYACRAGTKTPFHFGETIGTHQANYNGTFTYGNGKKGIYRQKTVEVGQFPPNAWGLYDMHGNVWEWTASVYDEAYAGGELKVAADDSNSLSLRGGAWYDRPLGLRCSDRSRNYPGGWNYNRGFRLARTF